MSIINSVDIAVNKELFSAAGSKTFYEMEVNVTIVEASLIFQFSSSLYLYVVALIK